MELSEEEKKAIEKLEDFIEDDEIQNISVFTAKKIKNIIDRQQKEIEELKKDNDTLSELVIVNEDKVIKELDLISKDKIREKIEELESLSKNITMQPSIYNYEIDLLKELLEENNEESDPL